MVTPEHATLEMETTLFQVLASVSEKMVEVLEMKKTCHHPLFFIIKGTLCCTEATATIVSNHYSKGFGIKACS